MLAQTLFWLSGAGVFYTFIGYPALIGALARSRPRPPARGIGGDNAELADVCVVVVARNEAARIRARIENLLASDYPAQKLRVLIVSDGSTDATADEVAAMAAENPRIGILERVERG